jgi:hypothetical protein
MEDRKTTPGVSPPQDVSPENSGPSDAPDQTPPDARDQTLGGYHEVHERPPAFSGADGQPYTASVEVESVENLANPFVAFLVFPRWAETGLGIVGHVETPVLCEGKSREEVEDHVHGLPLIQVKRLLDEAIQRQGTEGDHEGWR